MSAIKSTIWAVGGGKGNIGKSFVSAVLSCSLAQSGFKTLLIDADTAKPSIHTFFGIDSPSLVLGDYIEGTAENIEDVLIPTQQDNLKLLCNAGEILELTNLEYPLRARLLKGFSSVKSEYIIVDIGAESEVRALDFFNTADLGIIVTSSTAASIQNAFAYLKLAVTRKLIRVFTDYPTILEMLKSQLVGEGKANSMSLLIERVENQNEIAAKMIMDALWSNKYRLLVNKTSDEAGENVLRTLIEAAEQYLSLPLSHLGNITFNDELEEAVKINCPISLEAGSEFSESIEKITHALIAHIRMHKKETHVDSHSETGEHEKPPKGTVPAEEHGEAAEETLEQETTIVQDELSVLEDVFETEEPAAQTEQSAHEEVLDTEEEATRDTLEENFDLDIDKILEESFEQEQPTEPEAKISPEIALKISNESSLVISKSELGLNDDVQYNGKVLHVQTEDLGSEKEKIVTHVFHRGQILFSTASNYDQLENRDNMTQAIRKKVKWQHKVVMAGISSGKLKERLDI